MRNILIISIALLIISCKKEEVVQPLKQETPISGNGRLQVIYSTSEPIMHTKFGLNNIWMEESLKDTNYLKLDTIVQGDQPCQAYITEPGTGLNTLIVVFETDTLINFRDINSKCGGWVELKFIQ